MNAHELAKLLLEGPDLPVELWIQDSPASAINGACEQLEVWEDVVQLSTWKD